MKKNYLINLFIIGFYLLSTHYTVAQNIFLVKGKVIDAQTNEPIPFVSVNFKSSSIAKNTDFEGNFSFELSKLPSNSLIFSSLGYQTKEFALSKDSLLQNIRMYLPPSEIKLNEVKVYAKGENPAFKIIRSVVERKKENNFKNLEGFDYNSYTKIEVDLNNLGKKLQERNITKKVSEAINQVGTLKDEDGKNLIPTFISESYSHYFFRNNPRLSKEIIERTNVKGVGVTDGSLTSQVIGSTFQQYNFYQNQVEVLNKTFTSPIADDWKLVYDYFLMDSVYFGDAFCYKIDFIPKRKQDLAFSGSIWVEKKSFALAQIDVTISKDANLNFIDRIKIQQESEPIGQAWFPVKNRIVVDVANLSESAAGLLIKFTGYNENINSNTVQDAKFFDQAIEINPNFSSADSKYWQMVRPEPFSQQEELAFKMIDTIKNIKVIKKYSDLMLLLSSGYKKIFTGIELGPLVYSAALNDLEGFRLRLGFRTNTEFSKNWVLSAYAAYGTKDENWKMGAEVTRIFSRKPWTTLSIKTSNDLEQVGLRGEDLGLGAIFSAYLRFGTMMRPYYENEHKLQFQREIKKGIFTTLGFRTRSFEPLFDFSYRTDYRLAEFSPVIHQFNTSEFFTDLTFARDELAIINDNERLSFGTVKSPTFSVKYVLGARNLLNSDFNYHKLTLKLSHTLNLSYFGKTYYKAESGLILGNLPYPLLKSHLGNESVFIISNAYNLMNNFEFVSDKYLSFRYLHDFEGLFFNRFPGIKKLKWRTFTTGKFLLGDLSRRNLEMNNFGISDTYNSFMSLNRVPYIELGYGVSNIFKFLRVEAIHRMTHLNNPGISKFGVKISADITL